MASPAARPDVFSVVGSAASALAALLAAPSSLSGSMTAATASGGAGGVVAPTREETGAAWLMYSDDPRFPAGEDGGRWVFVLHSRGCVRMRMCGIGVADELRERYRQLLRARPDAEALKSFDAIERGEWLRADVRHVVQSHRHRRPLIPLDWSRRCGPHVLGDGYLRHADAA